jgi:hypothetical protein
MHQAANPANWSQGIVYDTKAPWLSCQGASLNNFLTFYSGNEECCSDKILIA